MTGAPRVRELTTTDGRYDAANQAPSLTDLSREILLLREMIRDQANDKHKSGPANLELIGKSIERLARVLKTHNSLSGNSDRRLDELLGSLLREVGSELGINEPAT